MIDSKKLPLLAALLVLAGILAFLVKGSLDQKPLVVTPVSPAAAPAESAKRPVPAEFGTPPPAAKASRVVQLRSGTTRDLAQPPGKFLLLHFWATWCPPCVEEMPGLLAFLKEKKGDKDLELLAVSVDDDWPIVDSWLKKHGAADLPVALDSRSETASAFGTKKFPETFIISPKGDVLLWVKGPLDWQSAAFRKQLEDVRKLAKSKTTA